MACRIRTIFIPAIIACLSLPGCGVFRGGQSELTISSRRLKQVDLETTFDTAYYAKHDQGAITVVLIEGKVDNPRSAAVVRMFWPPRAGQTALNQTATNTTIQYLAFGPSLLDRRPARYTDDAALYNGAGFLHLGSSTGPATLSASLWQANLKLADRSEQYIDRVGPSLLAGGLTATRDQAKVRRLLDRLNQMLYTHLGYPRLVDIRRCDHPASNNALSEGVKPGTTSPPSNESPSLNIRG